MEGCTEHLRVGENSSLSLVIDFNFVLLDAFPDPQLLWSVPAVKGILPPGEVRRCFHERRIHRSFFITSEIAPSWHSWAYFYKQIDRVLIKPLILVWKEVMEALPGVPSLRPNSTRKQQHADALFVRLIIKKAFHDKCTYLLMNYRRRSLN